MMIIKMILQYEGTKYHGWQRQKNTKGSIEERVEEAISKVLKKDIKVHAAGRTDMGVHAMGQVAHFLLEEDKDIDPYNLLDSINNELPLDIRILKLEKAPQRFHARLLAKKKHYRYRIRMAKHADAINRRIEWCFGEKLDLKKMQQAAALLCGTHDYRSLCDERKKDKNTVKRIDSITLFVPEYEKDLLILDFFGDGFLYHMVRKLTSLLVEVGTGRLEPCKVLDYVDRPEVTYEGLAPAKGLMLMEVFYE